MKTLIDLEKNECRFAFGDGPFLFCADATKPGSSYCAEHHAICFKREYTLHSFESPRFSALLRKSNLPAVTVLQDFPA